MTAVVDSKHQMLETEEIINIAAQETGSPYSPEQTLASVMAECNEGGAILMREGNTLFVINKSPKDPSIGLFRALNADTARNYIQNSIVFVEAAAAAGFRVLVTTFYDPSILSIFKYISRNPPLPNMGYAVQKSTGQAGEGYRVTLSLGNGATKGGLPNPRLTEQGNI